MAIPSWAGAVLTTRPPALRYQASTPSASHHAPIASTDSAAASIHARAGPAPRAAVNVGSE